MSIFQRCLICRCNKLFLCSPEATECPNRWEGIRALSRGPDGYLLPLGWATWQGHGCFAIGGVGLGAWRDKLLEDRRVQQIHGQSSRDMAIWGMCLSELLYLMGELWSFTGEQRFCTVQHFQSKESDWVSFCGTPLALYHIVPFCYPETCMTIVRLFQVSSISFYACVQGIENEWTWRPLSAHFTVIFNRHVFLPAPRMYHVYPNTHCFKSISLYVQ